MADLKSIADQLVNLTVKDVNELEIFNSALVLFDNKALLAPLSVSYKK